MTISNEILILTELRNWLLLLLGTIGAFITIRTYINSKRQRKIDNTFKTIDFLRQHISEQGIETFIELFHANNELSEIKHNEFKLSDGRTDPIEAMFSEGGCGNGDIHNMIELFNLISPTLKDLEINIIWYEYGQIMSKLYQWTNYLEEIEKSTKEDKFPTFYSNFNTYMEKNITRILLKPTKYYTYIE